MPAEQVTDRQRRLAEMCLNCPLCSHARRKQKGLAFFLVKTLGSTLCPFGRAYKKVYDQPPHEPPVEST